MKQTKNKKFQAFTLVELIIVITILAILATIAFLSFQGYATQSRDANRLSTLANLEKGISVFLVETGKAPFPENAITLQSSGQILGYQGAFGEQNLRQVKVSQNGQDPDGTDYVFSTNLNRTAFQIGGFLEKQTASVFSQTHASNVNYTNRYFHSLGTPLGMLFINSGSLINTPLNTLYNPVSFTGIDVKTFTGTLSNGVNVGELKVVFDNIPANTVSGTGETLAKIESSFSGKMQILMKSCPSGWTDKGVFGGRYGISDTTTKLNGADQTYKLCEGSSLSNSAEIVMIQCPNGWTDKGVFGLQHGVTRLNLADQTYKVCEGISLNNSIEIVMIQCPNGWTDKGVFGGKSGLTSLQTKLSGTNQTYKVCQKN